MFIRLVHTSDTVECDDDLKFDCDHIELLGLYTIVTVLKVKVKVRVWNFGSQLEYRSSSPLEFLIFYTVEIRIEFN